MIDNLMIAICHEFAEDNIVDKALAQAEIDMNIQDKINIANDIRIIDPKTTLSDTELDDVPERNIDADISSIKTITDIYNDIENIPDNAEIPSDIIEYDNDYIINDDIIIFGPSIEKDIIENNPEDDIPEWAHRLESSLINHGLFNSRPPEVDKDTDPQEDDFNEPNYIEVDDEFNDSRN